MKLSIIEWKLLQWMAKPSPSNAYHSFTVCRTSHLDQSVSVKVYFSCQSDLVREAEKAALRIKDRGWTYVDEYSNNRLNAAGLQAAAQLLPEWNAPKPPKLIERDFDVLYALEYASKTGWASPLDCGGCNGSYHSASLTKLTHHGFAECRKGNKILSGSNIIPEPSLRRKPKGSRHFRITEAGKAALKERQNDR